MSKKRSPGTDDRELLLAKCLQNALARNLGFSAGVAYVDKYNDAVGSEDAAACCVLGAAWLEGDTSKETAEVFGLVDGNDSTSEFWTSDTDHEDVGYAFRQAMTDPNE